MEDPTTIALNLTFFGTLGLAFVMFLGLFLVFIATLVIAGVGRLAAVLIMAMFGRFPGEDTVDVVRLPGSLAAPSVATPENEDTKESTGPASVTPTSTPTGPRNPKRISGVLRTATGHLPLIGKTHRAPAEMAPDWAEAVALADARAVARARAEKPAINAAVHDVPPPGVLPEAVPQGGPVSRIRVGPAPQGRSGPVPVPRSFKKPPTPGTEDLLDTGSLVSLAARPKSESVK
ncbi:hypothetical protein ACW0JT_05210 [Arthrobacter sp. SA17]